MTIYYLYVKTHRKTGLKYLGQTASNPYKYKGSGKEWKQHLTRYGHEHDTHVLKECISKDERNHWGRYYSELWNIVESSEWANLIPESGGGGLLGSKNSATTDIVKEKFSGKNHYMKRDTYISANNPRYDTSVYDFENINTGEKVSMTQNDLRTLYKLDAGNLSRVIKGKQSSIHGWRLNK